MTENKYLIDSSAWIEYFEGTSTGSSVKQLLENPRNECYFCEMIICEVTSKIARKGLDPVDYFQTMKTMAKGVGETTDDYYSAGIKHAEWKKEIDRISYVDALLMVISETRHLKIVSKDTHLKGKNTLLLK